MNTIIVDNLKLENEFIKFPVELYKNNKEWIRPLDNDIRDVFDPNVNKNYLDGYCKRWILKENNKIIGRIAAFYSSKHLNDSMKVGGIGFFECINSQKAANLLFDTCKKWLEENGCEAMDGPINFGDRDKWWGLLTKGYDLEPIYQQNYNFPYYKQLLESYGFQVYFEYYTFIRNVRDPFHPRIMQKSEILNKDPDYSFRHLKMKEFDKFVKDIVTVYNKAWVKHEGVSELSDERASYVINQLKPVLDEKIVWLAYYKNEPVAFYINIPEINQMIKHANGKVDLIGKIKIGFYKLIRANKKMQGLVFGVVPEHQGKGLDGALIMAVAKMVQEDYHRYPILEITGIGDFNRKMLLVVKQVGGDIAKVHSTYRLLFDSSIPFERMKEIK